MLAKEALESSVTVSVGRCELGASPGAPASQEGGVSAAGKLEALCLAKGGALSDLGEGTSALR